jgi:hypothetical protein
MSKTTPLSYENSIKWSGDSGSNAEVSDYYAKTLEKTEDLQTNCCTTAGAPPPHVRKCISKIHDDVLAKYYG